MDSILFWIVPAASVLALLMAWYFYKGMMRESEGTDTMRKIASYVRQGAMSYLRQQYKIVGMVFLGLVILFSIMAYGFGLQNPWVPIAFLTGGFFSGLAGYLGMKTATYASARTANAASQSLNAGLRVAFRSGAVMGLVVVGLGLLDISFWYILLSWIEPADGTHKLTMITTTMLTFGMGASTQALFARVGGGIYTKAADVGADLVGKVEAGIPEDDPRNPATIADNVATMWATSPAWAPTSTRAIAALSSPPPLSARQQAQAPWAQWMSRELSRCRSRRFSPRCLSRPSASSCR